MAAGLYVTQVVTVLPVTLRDGPSMIRAWWNGVTESMVGAGCLRLPFGGRYEKGEKRQSQEGTQVSKPGWPRSCRIQYGSLYLVPIASDQFGMA